MTHLLRVLPFAVLLAACDGDDDADERKPVDAPAQQVAPSVPPAESASGAPATPASTVTLPQAPAGAKIEFVSPKEGDKVKSPVKVVMKAEGIEVKPAGDAAPSSGHHHLIVDGQAIPAGTVVPKDATHIHFGQGQGEAEVELAPGEHTLTLQFADGNHISYGDALSKTIHVTVE